LDLAAPSFTPRLRLAADPPGDHRTRNPGVARLPGHYRTAPRNIVILRVSSSLRVSGAAFTEPGLCGTLPLHVTKRSVAYQLSPLTEHQLSLRILMLDHSPMPGGGPDPQPQSQRKDPVRSKVCSGCVSSNPGSPRLVSRVGPTAQSANEALDRVGGEGDRLEQEIGTPTKGSDSRRSSHPVLSSLKHRSRSSRQGSHRV
jgi:hypothetical protein